MYNNKESRTSARPLRMYDTSKPFVRPDPTETIMTLSIVGIVDLLKSPCRNSTGSSTLFCGLMIELNAEVTLHTLIFLKLLFHFFCLH